MTYPIRFRARVGRDLAAGRSWYESRGGTALGERFLAAVTATFRRIEAQPESFQLLNDEVRHAVVHRFPYVVFFLFESDQVVVLAVLHSSRNPALWPRVKTGPH